jgi:uncharacterized protein YndB with AHSA1/START domain
LTAGGGSQAAVRQAVLHGSFTLERDLAASPDRVFSGYADLSVRRRWFRMPGDPSRGSHELDFRIGGHEVVTGVFAPGGAAEEALSYRSTFWDLEPGARIVFSYSVTVDGVRRWASLVTVSLSALPLPTPAARPAGDGTRLRHTEQYACLAYAGDGAQDVAHLKGSLPLQLNGLAAALSAAG